MKKLDVSPIEVEKVAYVIAKEQAPPAKEPSGRGRGRPAGSTNTKKNPQEPVRRSERQSSASDAAEAQKVKRSKVAKVGKNVAEPKKRRGRPKENSAQESEGSSASTATGKKRGRPPGKKAVVESESSGSGSGNKRGRPPGSTKVNGAKRQKT
jgi:hypothetical protein